MGEASNARLAGYGRPPLSSARSEPLLEELCVLAREQAPGVGWTVGLAPRRGSATGWRGATIVALHIAARPRGPFGPTRRLILDAFASSHESSCARVAGPFSSVQRTPFRRTCATRSDCRCSGRVGRESYLE